MGFKIDRTYVLKFEGGMDGAEVRIRSTPVSVMLELGGTVPYERMAELMQEYIQSWNLEDADGEPIKVEQQAILNGLERVHIARIVREWARAATGVSAPLDEPSTSGEQSPEVELPMETL